MRVAWLTDIHLNCVELRDRLRFFEQVRRSQPDLVAIGGDIAESRDVLSLLELMAGEFECPLAFVLGNHDYYYSSILRVREQVTKLCLQRPELTYLSAGDFVPLTPRAALIGHDGWADGRAGDYNGSNVMLSDYGLIAELAGLSKAARRLMLHALGDEAGRHIRRVLPPAAERHEQVLLLTHVPPLLEACWHEGRVSDAQWAPHFTCLAVGEAILEIMPDYPATQLTVLCGHTHGEGETQPLPNVRILTGGAEYGKPRVTNVFDVE
jgi:Icc protein